MLKDIYFRTALAISFSAHLLLFSSGGLFHIFNINNIDKNPNKEIEVTYIIQKPEERVMQNLPQKYDIPERKTEVPLRKEVNVAKKQTLPISEEPAAESISEISDIEHLEEYISYYQLIREKVKKRVKSNYTKSSEEGIAYLVFSLMGNGDLKNLEIDDSRSSKSEYLRKTALKSLKEASPFPPFPRSIKKREITFSIAVIFKKE